LALTNGKKGIFPICFPFFGALRNFAYWIISYLCLDFNIECLYYNYRKKRRERIVFIKICFWRLMRILKKFHRPWSMIV
jgi:hypothetical protein